MVLRFWGLALSLAGLQGCALLLDPGYPELRIRDASLPPDLSEDLGQDALAPPDTQDEAGLPDISQDLASPDLPPETSLDVLGDRDEGGRDIGSEVAADGSLDAAQDAPRDAMVDAGTRDARLDAVPDLGTDTGMDTGTDLGTDSGTDLGTDSGTDVGLSDAVVETRCRTNADCNAGEFCAGPLCAGIGVCEARPRVCLDIYRPVCGCDRRTYSSECHARSEGVRVMAEGECSRCADATCPTGQSCCEFDGRCFLAACMGCCRPVADAGPPRIACLATEVRCLLGDGLGGVCCDCGPSGHLCREVPSGSTCERECLR